MKLNLKCFVAVPIMLLLSAIRVSAQDDPTILLTNFQDALISKFTNNGQGITENDIQSGKHILLKVKLNTSHITAIQMRNGANNFRPVTDASTAETGYKIYKLSVFKKNTAGEVEIKLLAGETTKLLRLAIGPAATTIVDSDDEPVVADYLSGDCPNPVTFTTKPTGSLLAYTKTGKPFNEKLEDYPDGKIVYVYDFDPKKSTKVFYKISKNKDGTDLECLPINFNRETLGPNNLVQIKIVNINKFMYDISVDHQVVNYQSEPSALFTQFFLGDSNLLGSLMSVYSSGVSAQARSPEKAKLNKLLKDLRCFLETYNGFNAQMLQAYNSCGGFLDCQDFDYQKFANELLHIRLEAAEFQGLVNDAKSAQVKANDEITKCTKAETDLASAEKEIKRISAIKEADRSKEDKDKLTALGEEAIKKLKDAVCKDDAKKANQSAKDAADETVKSYAAISDLFVKLPSENDIKKLAVFINNLVYPNMVHVVNELNMKGNRLDVSIDIKAKDSLVKYVPVIPYHEINNFSIPIILKPFISFSSGSFIGIGNRLKNKTYDYQPLATNKLVSDTSRYILAESGYSKPVVGFTALGNVEWKVNGSLGLGLSAGVGLTIEKSPRLSYLGGLSAFLGDERQFVLTAGVAAMQVDVLKSNLAAAQEQGIQYTNSTKQPVEYYKKLNTGWFISLTFTPFTTNKKP